MWSIFVIACSSMIPNSTNRLVLCHSDGLINSLTTLHEATLEIKGFPLPMAEFGQIKVTKGMSMSPDVEISGSMKMEKELSEKLERLDRLNGEVMRGFQWWGYKSK
ncbi:hypothetical protein VC83_07047 [Pseudogymnoascus destructans]|uniref:Uncharacterized protein n=1 Tax=Pseudogymnoascus destructans TaxID=655981 RepID=A0A177A6Z2_9PEZI|nr:uncharacterized protein VC83_07047 [Pseudogymnoascus destructans]OAF56804.1 hypothetical protein VC83_07047 [Pseudogymnoascus destructans]